MITVKKPKELEQYIKLLKEFDKRLVYSMDESLKIIAENGSKFIKSRIPDLEDNEDTDYKNSLDVRKIDSPRKDESYIAIVADSSNLSQKHVRDIKPHENIIYIQTKKTPRKRIEPWMDMLESLSPWTIDTLPYMPSEKEADIFYRRVTKQETNFIRKNKTIQKPYINDMLRRSGIRPEKTFKGRDLDISENEHSITPDFAFNALRLEFGIGRERAIPHWRPMHIKARTIDILKIARNKTIKDVLTNPSNRQWKKSSRSAMTVNEAMELTKFQGKIG